MRLTSLLLAALLLAAPIAAPAAAQGRSELALSIGGGSLLVGREGASPYTDPGGGATQVVSISYQFHITSHFSAEGALDSFLHKFMTGPLDARYLYKDDYVGAEAAVVYHFRSNRRTGCLLPFVVAGIGKTSTDFTEIQATPYYRLGAGAGYNFSERFGLRFEVRHEIITRLWTYREPTGHLPSLRLGLVYRF